MLTDTWATVTAVDGEQATIRIDDNGCGRCGEPGGCAGKHLGKLLCATPRSFRVRNPERCGVGARVRVGVADGALGRSALHAYAFPLLALIAGALLGSAIAGEAAAIGGAITGLLIGWLGLRRAQQRSLNDERCLPSIRP